MLYIKNIKGYNTLYNIYLYNPRIIGNLYYNEELLPYTFSTPLLNSSGNLSLVINDANFNTSGNQLNLNSSLTLTNLTVSNNTFIQNLTAASSQLILSSIGTVRINDSTSTNFNSTNLSSTNIYASVSNITNSTISNLNTTLYNIQVPVYYTNGNLDIKYDNYTIKLNGDNELKIDTNDLIQASFSQWVTPRQGPIKIDRYSDILDALGISISDLATYLGIPEEIILSSTFIGFRYDTDHFRLKNDGATYSKMALKQTEGVLFMNSDQLVSMNSFTASFSNNNVSITNLISPNITNTNLLSTNASVTNIVGSNLTFGSITLSSGNFNNLVTNLLTCTSLARFESDTTIASAFITNQTSSNIFTNSAPSLGGHVTNKTYVDAISYITAGTGLSKTGSTISVDPTKYTKWEAYDARITTNAEAITAETAARIAADEAQDVFITANAAVGAANTIAVAAANANIDVLRNIVDNTTVAGNPGTFLNTADIVATESNKLIFNPSRSNLFITNLTTTNLFSTNITTSNFNVSGINSTNIINTGYITTDIITSNNLITTNITNTNLISTNITTSNFNVSGINSTNIINTGYITSDIITSNNLITTNITNTNLISTNITNTNLLTSAANIISSTISNAVITNITNTNLISTNITNTNLISTNITNTNLLTSAANIVNSSVSNAVITNLTNTNLVLTNITNTNLITTNITNTNLLTSAANIVNCSVSNAVITNLTNTNLVLTNITNTNLISTNITNTNLITTNITNTNLRNTDITNTNIYNTNIYGPQYITSGNSFYFWVGGGNDYLNGAVFGNSYASTSAGLRLEGNSLSANSSDLLWNFWNGLSGTKTTLTNFSGQILNFNGVNDNNYSGNYQWFSQTNGSTNANSYIHNDFNGQNNILNWNGHGSVSIGKVPGSTYQLELSGDNAGKSATSTWTVTSDKRTKKNIKSKKNDNNILLNKINNLELKEFEYIDDFEPEQKVHLGLIADDVKEHFPAAVRTFKNKLKKRVKTGLNYPYDEEEIVYAEYNDFKDLNYHEIFVSLIGCIQELSRRIEILENK